MKESNEFKDLINSMKLEKEEESIFTSYESISNYGYEINGYKRAEDLFNKFVKFYYENREKYFGKIEETFLDFTKLEYVQSELRDFYGRFCSSMIRFMNFDKLLMNGVYYDNIKVPNDITLSELLELIHVFIEGERNYNIEGEE